MTAKRMAIPATLVTVLVTVLAAMSIASASGTPDVSEPEPYNKVPHYSKEERPYISKEGRPYIQFSNHEYWTDPAFTSSGMYQLELERNKLTQFDSGLNAVKTVALDFDSEQTHLYFYGGQLDFNEPYFQNYSDYGGYFENYITHSKRYTTVRVKGWQDRVLVSQRSGIQFFDRDLNKIGFMKLAPYKDGTIFDYLVSKKKRLETDTPRIIFNDMNVIGDTLILEVGKFGDNREAKRVENLCIAAEAYDLKSKQLIWRIHSPLCPSAPKGSGKEEGLLGIMYVGDYIVERRLTSVEATGKITKDSSREENEIEKEYQFVYSYLFRDPRTRSVVAEKKVKSTLDSSMSETELKKVLLSHVVEGDFGKDSEDDFGKDLNEARAIKRWAREISQSALQKSMLQKSEAFKEKQNCIFVLNGTYEKGNGFIYSRLYRREEEQELKDTIADAEKGCNRYQIYRLEQGFHLMSYREQDYFRIIKMNPTPQEMKLVKPLFPPPLPSRDRYDIFPLADYGKAASFPTKEEVFIRFFDSEYWTDPVFHKDGMFLVEGDRDKITKFDPFLRFVKSIPLKTHFVSPRAWKDKILITQKDGVQFFDTNLNKTDFMSFSPFFKKYLKELTDSDRDSYDVARYIVEDKAVFVTTKESTNTMSYMGEYEEHAANKICLYAEAYDLKTKRPLWSVHNEYCKKFPEKSKFIYGLDDIEVSGDHLVEKVFLKRNVPANTSNKTNNKTSTKPTSKSHNSSSSQTQANENKVFQKALRLRDTTTFRIIDTVNPLPAYYTDDFLSILKKKNWLLGYYAGFHESINNCTVVHEDDRANDSYTGVIEMPDKSEEQLIFDYDVEKLKKQFFVSKMKENLKRGKCKEYVHYNTFFGKNGSAEVHRLSRESAQSYLDSRNW